MFSWFKKKKKVVLGSELEQVVQILFPQLSTETLPDGTVFHVDYSVDTNLESVLYELQDGVNTTDVHKVVNNVIKRLIEARKVLEAYPKINQKAVRIIVDIPMEKDNESDY
jgi:hypothetical protein